MEDWNGDMDYDVSFCLNCNKLVYIYFFFQQFDSPSRRIRRKKRGWDSSKFNSKIMYSVLYIEIDTRIIFIFFPFPALFCFTVNRSDKAADRLNVPVRTRTVHGERLVYRFIKCVSSSLCLSCSVNQELFVMACSDKMVYITLNFL